MTELLPCPFCASTNLKVYLNAPASDMRPWEHVACLDCGTGQTTVEKWNTRAPIVIDDAMVERGAAGAWDSFNSRVAWSAVHAARKQEWRDLAKGVLSAALNPQEENSDGSG